MNHDPTAEFELQSIPRKKNVESEDSFASLRREGIALAQQLSGDLWTDYNDHDPGVTILENLCYALTELSYRADFDIVDYLIGDDGALDCEKQVLHPPDRILPCRPTTVGDYRRLLLDSVPGIDNVWLYPQDGTYRLEVSLADGAAVPQPDVIDEVKCIFRRFRNLGEDLEEPIAIIDKVDCTIEATIDVSGTVDPDGVLAAVYHTCSRYIEAGVQFHSFEQVLKEGRPLDEILTGPFTVHGVIGDDGLGNDNDNDIVIVSDLVSKVNGVLGVSRTRQLVIKKGNERFGAVIERRHAGATLRLRIPTNQNELGEIRMLDHGRTVQVSMSAFRTHLAKLQFEHEANRRTRQDVGVLCRRPQGQVRDLQGYHSIQNQFPSIYGLNQYSARQSVLPGARARVNQLKTFLLLFDQLLANGAANLRHLRDLFSIRADSKQSYGVRLLDDTVVPGIDEVYREPSASIEREVFRKYDNYADRRNRLLDYLLGLYGEGFSERNILGFHHYHDALSVDDELIRMKTAFAKSIVKVGRDRAAGFDYGEKSWGESSNVSGLERRVCLLLGFGDHGNRSLAQPVLTEGLRIVPQEQFARVREGTLELRFIDIDESFRRVPALDREIGSSEVRRVIETIAPLRSGLLSDALLRGGLDLQSYRLGQHSRSDCFQLVFRPSGQGRWWYLGTYGDEASGQLVANALRRFLIDLSIACEGLHVVEHILLRPEGGAQLASDRFRLSVLLPAWTARCTDIGFRELAQELIGENCPAHVLPECHWLEFDAMCDFERRYETWLEAKRAGSVQERDDFALLLREYLEALPDG